MYIIKWFLAGTYPFFHDLTKSSYSRLFEKEVDRAKTPNTSFLLFLFLFLAPIRLSMTRKRKERREKKGKKDNTILF